MIFWIRWKFGPRLTLWSNDKLEIFGSGAQSNLARCAKAATHTITEDNGWEGVFTPSLFNIQKDFSCVLISIYCNNNMRLMKKHLWLDLWHFRLRPLTKSRQVMNVVTFNRLTGGSSCSLSVVSNHYSVLYSTVGASSAWQKKPPDATGGE